MEKKRIFSDDRRTVMFTLRSESSAPSLLCDRCTITGEERSAIKNQVKELGQYFKNTNSNSRSLTIQRVQVHIIIE
jgi:hypothetical protein